jgi:hypothetical protein
LHDPKGETNETSNLFNLNFARGKEGASNLFESLGYVSTTHRGWQSKFAEIPF